jgi:hypothetical protein
MVKKRGLLFIVLFILFTKLVFAQWVAPENPKTYDWDNSDISHMSTEQASEFAKYVPPERISEINDPTARDNVIKTKWNLGITDIGSSSFTISGNTLTVGGSTVDLSTMAGKAISVSGNEVIVDGKKYNNAQNLRKEGDSMKADSVQYLESGTTTVINAEGVTFSQNAFEIEKADSVTYEGSTSTKVVKFKMESGTFRVNSADLVIVETITFSKIKNSTFVLKNQKLESASVTSDKANNSVKFPNLVTGSSQYISVNYDLDKSFGINYRTERDKVDFRLDEGIDLLLLNSRNISFTSYDNSTFTIIGNRPPIYRFKNGVLNYSSSETTEQLESTCGLSEANIDLALGFVRTALSPANITVLCSGSRYNLIDKIIKEKSYSIYNNKPLF